MAENAFDKGIDYLREALQKVQEVDAKKAALASARQESKRLKKQIAQLSKEKNEEMTTTIKKRKAEIHAAYDKELDVIRGKVKKTDASRLKHKERQQDERYDVETVDFRKEIEVCEMEIKNILKQNHIMRFCRRDLFYSLFLPRGAKDILILFLTAALCLFVLPFVGCLLVKYVLLKNAASLAVYYVLIFVCFVCLSFIVYLLIVNRTKVRYPAQLKECRNQKMKIRAIKKQMRAVRNKIEKDKDESGYDLSSFDDQLAVYQQEMDKIGAQRKQALLQFEEEKRAMVEAEIAGPYEEKIRACEEQLKKEEDLIDQQTSALAALRLAITDEYEAYLGKEFVNEERLEILISIMEEGAATIGDAIQVYNGKMEIEPPERS